MSALCAKIGKCHCLVHVTNSVSFTKLRKGGFPLRRQLSSSAFFSTANRLFKKKLILRFKRRIPRPPHPPTHPPTYYARVARCDYKSITTPETSTLKQWGPGKIKGAASVNGILSIPITITTSGKIKFLYIESTVNEPANVSPAYITSATLNY